jgi:hypothetical protein
LSPVSARIFLSLTLEARPPTALVRGQVAGARRRRRVGSTVRPGANSFRPPPQGFRRSAALPTTISGDRRNHCHSSPCRGDLLALLPRAVSSGGGRPPASRGRRSGLTEGFTIRCSQTSERTVWIRQTAQCSRPGASDAFPSGAGPGIATPPSALAEWVPSQTLVSWTSVTLRSAADRPALRGFLGMGAAGFEPATSRV